MKIRFRFLGIIVFFIFSNSLSYALTAEEAYQAGLALYKEGRWEQSIDQFREAVRLNPYHWKAYQGMGYAFAQDGNPMAALDACRISLQINPDDPSLRAFLDTKLKPQITIILSDSEDAYQAGSTFFKAGQWGQSIDKFREAIRQNPNHWQAYQSMGYAYVQNGDYRAALDACRISLQINPNNPTLQNYVDTKLKSLLANAPPDLEPPTSLATPVDTKIHNSFYLQLGGSAPAAPYGFQNGWSTGVEFGMGYGFGISRNFSIVLDATYSSFPIYYYYYPVIYYPSYNYFYYTGGGGIHFLTVLGNAKFNFTDRGNPVVFYGIAGIGPSIFFQDGLQASNPSYNTAGSSELDASLRLGLGIDIKLNPGLALTFENSTVNTFFSRNFSYQGSSLVHALFFVGLKMDQ